MVYEMPGIADDVLCCDYLHDETARVRSPSHVAPPQILLMEDEILGSSDGSCGLAKSQF